MTNYKLNKNKPIKTKTMNDKHISCEDYSDISLALNRARQKRLTEALTLPTPEEAMELVRKKNEAIDNGQLLRIIEAIKDADENYIIHNIPYLRPNVKAKLEDAGYIISNATDSSGSDIRRLKISWGE
jgi:hypothetical protein